MEEFVALKQVDSTSAYLRRLMDNGIAAPGCVVVADYQQIGRGQLGSSWESEAEANLLFSLLLQPDNFPAKKSFLLSQAVSVAIVEVLLAYDTRFTIKWPNDIYWCDQKISGILIENDLIDNSLMHSLVGIGLNVNQTEFHSSAPNPISLTHITHTKHDRGELLYDLLEAIHRQYHRLQQGEEAGICADYMAYLYRRSGEHRYRLPSGQEIRARLLGVLPSGRIELQRADGVVESFAFKEISFVF